MFFILQLIALPEVRASCPAGTTAVDTFSAEGKKWTACEDLAVPGGALVLMPADATGNVWLPKSYEPYSQGTDEEYYLGLGKQRVLDSKWDMLGDAILHGCPSKTQTTGLCEPTWAHVERAVPVMRYSQGNKDATGNNFMCSPYSVESGVRTFTGSRSASVDASFSDHADDCTDNGFPRPQGYVMNLTAIANGEPAVPADGWKAYVNYSGIAEGLVGAPSPNLIFYFPILHQNFSSFGGSRYWTMIASPVPDMEGGREQSVWFRFQQIICDGPHMQPPCSLKGQPQYYDTCAAIVSLCPQPTPRDRVATWQLSDCPVWRLGRSGTGTRTRRSQAVGFALSSWPMPRASTATCFRYTATGRRSYEQKV